MLWGSKWDRHSGVIRSLSTHTPIPHPQEMVSDSWIRVSWDQFEMHFLAHKSVGRSPSSQLSRNVLGKRQHPSAAGGDCTGSGLVGVQGVTRAEQTQELQDRPWS